MPIPQHVWLWLGTSNAVLRGPFHRMALGPWPLLITGEPGTGKSLLARQIHDMSGRTGPFIRESVACLAESVEHSELNGHVRGAFTGAHSDRTGLIERANGGSFFLEELGLARPALQAMLLKAFERSPVRPVGGNDDRQFDVRFIAATNEDLAAAVAEGRVRADLLERFGHFVLRLPPLRDRRDEILPLMREFLRRAAFEVGRNAPELSRELEPLLERAPWRDDVRGVESVCRYAILMSDPGQSIGFEHLPPDFLAEAGCGGVGPEPEKLSIDKIDEALVRTKGSIRRAARLLGVSERHIHRIRAKARGEP